MSLSTTDTVPRPSQNQYCLKFCDCFLVNCGKPLQNLLLKKIHIYTNFNHTWYFVVRAMIFFLKYPFFFQSRPSLDWMKIGQRYACPQKNPNKKKLLNSENYRPISLLPILGKVLGGSVCYRLCDHVKHLITKCQHSIFRQRSCTTHAAPICSS